MKSERRHELQKNELSDWILEQWEAVEPYWQLIAGGVILAIVLVWLIGYLATPAPRYAAEWRSLYDTLASSDQDQANLLRDFADRNQGTAPGMWARLYAADSFLAEGTRSLFFDRKKSGEELDKAVAAYTAALKEAKDDFVRVRATYGLAQAYEAKSDLEKAREHYQSVVKLAPEKAIGKESAKRLAWLAKPENQQFLTWFASATPNPFPAQKLPPSGMSAAPQPYDDLPDPFPELSLPDPEDISKPVPGVLPPTPMAPMGAAPMGTTPSPGAPEDATKPATPGLEPPAPPSESTPPASPAPAASPPGASAPSPAPEPPAPSEAPKP